MSRLATLLLVQLLLPAPGCFISRKFVNEPVGPEGLAGLVPGETTAGEVVEVGMSHLVYGDFMVPNADNKLYNEIKDTTKMVATVRTSPRQL